MHHSSLSITLNLGIVLTLTILSLGLTKVGAFLALRILTLLLIQFKLLSKKPCAVPSMLSMALSVWLVQITLLLLGLVHLRTHNGWIWERSAANVSLATPNLSAVDSVKILISWTPFLMTPVTIVQLVSNATLRVASSMKVSALQGLSLGSKRCIPWMSNVAEIIHFVDSQMY